MCVHVVHIYIYSIMIRIYGRSSCTCILAVVRAQYFHYYYYYIVIITIIIIVIVIVNDVDTMRV